MVVVRHKEGGVHRADEGTSRQTLDGALIPVIEGEPVEVAQIVCELALPGTHHHTSKGLLSPVLYGSLVTKVGIAVLLGEDATLDRNKVSRLSVLGRHRPG